MEATKEGCESGSINFLKLEGLKYMCAKIHVFNMEVPNWSHVEH
mgnify:CR=1 FL=1